MSRRLTIDKAGRIVLPKPLRDELQLEAGDTLEVESSGDEITLRPMRGHAQLRKKHGIWVYRSGEPLSQAVVEETVQQIRQEREKHILSKRS
jgi:AbrB family looped-hinge helix DNA binding protein